jgi:hypothetical protein
VSEERTSQEKPEVNAKVRQLTPKEEMELKRSSVQRIKEFKQALDEWQQASMSAGVQC